MRVAALAILVALLPAGGLAYGAGVSTDALIEQAQAKYADLDIEAATPLLDKAFRQPGNSRFQMVRIYHLWGLCLGSLGKYDAARDSFARALALDPSFRLGSDVSPRIRAPFEELLKSNPPRLDVQLIPPPFAEQGKPLSLTAKVASDTTGMARLVRVWFRRGNTGKFSSLKVSLGGPGQYPVTIAQPAWQTAGSQGPVFWFAVVENEFEGHLLDIGDEGQQLRLEVYDQQSAPPAAVAEETHWYQRWWVWTIIGVVAAGGVATAVLLTTPKPSGPFDFTVDFK